MTASAAPRACYFSARCSHTEPAYGEFATYYVVPAADEHYRFFEAEGLVSLCPDCDDYDLHDLSEDTIETIAA